MTSPESTSPPVTTASPPSTLRAAYIAMGALTFIVLAVAVWAPWHSVMSVDNRTYVEMVRGVADTGLPCLSNGPAAEFPELRARFDNVFNGRLCAAYPPLFAYFAQPAFRIGRVHGVIQFNVALLAGLAWLVFWIGRRTLRDPRAAAIAAWIAVTSSPLFLMASDASSYTLGIAFAFASVACAVEAIHATVAERRGFGFAALSGLFGSLAIGTQLLVMPMSLITVALLFVLRRTDEHELVPRFASPWLPSRGSLARGALAVAGMIPPLVAVALINHARFGSFNPISTGPCVWRACMSTGITKQAPSAMLAYAAPVFAWAAAWFVADRTVSRFARGRVVVAAVFVAMLFPDGTLREHAMRLARLAWGFVVDVSGLDMGDFWRPPDKLGVFLGPWAVRSTMQGAPAVAIALAVRGTDATRRQLAIVAGSVAALFLSLAMRAEVQTIYALGFPFVSLRYVSPAVPLLLLLAVAAVDDLPWRRWHLALLVVLAIAFTVWLVRGNDDHEWLRRFILLRGLPAAGFVAMLLAMRRRTIRVRGFLDAVVPVVCVLVFALGIGATLGVDGKATVSVRGGNDARVDAVARSTPPRFALVGWPPQIDTPLALRASRDIQYIDLFESENWANFRTLIDRWSAEGRPIFALWANDSIVSPWPEIVFVPVDRAEHLYRVVPVGRAH